MMINGNEQNQQIYERIQLQIEYLFEGVRKNLYGNGLELKIFDRMKQIQIKIYRITKIVFINIYDKEGVQILRDIFISYQFEEFFQNCTHNLKYIITNTEQNKEGFYAKLKRYLQFNN
ncbi:unnamed protein product [Paramecium pentaurelia]|uniref:Uncharacterized protein n=1 Tax=Paramecium pentaurelia TaxID=43138 RepID=A0A8S1VJP4_9CILI|nr:unnamed protein product [Paramecium pentaurelia]